MFRDDTLVGSWPVLVDRLDTAGALDRWAGLEPALHGIAGVEALAAAVRPGTDRGRADELLGALVRLAAWDGGDDPDAVLVLLHLLADGAYALASRLGDLSAEILPLVVGELTVQIRAFPWRRRTRAFAANLLMDTSRAVLSELLPHRTRAHPEAGEVLVDPLDEWAVATVFDRTVAGPYDDELDVTDVLVWAQRTGILDAEGAAILVAFERARTGAAATRVQVAAQFGLTEWTLRRRRRRALAGLRAAAGTYLAAVA